MTTKHPLGVLVSGSGTNLQALLDACDDPDFPAKVELVLSNKPTAFALERARQAGVAVAIFEPRAFPTRDEFDAAMVAALREHRVEWVCLAGFMRLLSPGFLQAFPNRVLNIHPALLPSFPGLHAARQALEHGAKITGCTVHLVDAGTDTGPIVAQAAVPVLGSDTEDSLSARIQEEEHRLYPAAVRLVCNGAFRLEGRGVKTERGPAVGSLSLRNPGE